MKVAQLTTRDTCQATFEGLDFQKDIKMSSQDD